MSAVFLPLPLGEGWGEGGLRVREPSAEYLAQAEPALLRGFELLTTAPGGVAKLRGLILSLAVEGRLTQSATTDGTAFDLIRQISVEKSHPMASSSKKGKALVAEVPEDDVPFRLPQAWCWVRLGDATTYGSCEKARDISDETWVLDLEDIEKDTGRLLQRKTFAERCSQSDKNVFRTGDVLYGKLRPYLNKVFVADRAGVCTTEILPLRLFAGISPHYLKVALQSPYFLEYVNSRSYGMKMPRLGTEDGRSAPIPLPPLAEQHRIVARVEELMKLCDALEQSGRLADEQHVRLTSTLFDALAASESAHALAENWQRIAEHFDLLLDRPEAIDALEQTILQLAVRGLLVPQQTSSALEVLDGLESDGVPFDLPVGWRWTTFGEVWSSSLYGPRFGSEDYVSDGGIPTVRTTDMSGGRIVLKDAPRVKVPTEKLDSYLVRRGDLLVTRSGSIGVMALFDLDVDVIPSAYLIRLRFTKDVVPSFCQLFLTCDLGKSQLGISTTAVGVPNVSASKMAQFVFPLPPLAEQTRIIARVEELRRICVKLRNRLTDAQHTQSRLAEALVAQATAA